MTSPFFRRPRRDDDYAPVHDQQAPLVYGLPFGIEPPPVPRPASIEWATDAVENARLGIPSTNHPARPLPIEEAAIRHFDADTHERSNWTRMQAGRLPALHGQANDCCATLTADRDRLDGQIVWARDDLRDQREQLVDQDLKFPQASAGVSNLVVALTCFAGGVEVITNKPIFGRVGGLDDATAWSMSLLSVGAITLTSWLLGSTLHRTVTYEGPARTRRWHVLKCVVLGVFCAVAMMAVVGMRVAGRNKDVTSLWEAFLAGLMYAVMQGASQLGAMAHGWWHANPRVRQIKATEVHTERLEGERALVADALGEAQVWAQSLEVFNPHEWVASQNAQLAQEYGAKVLEYRNLLEKELLKVGRVEEAEMLHILPLPQFVPPVIKGPDDDDWLTGFPIIL